MHAINELNQKFGSAGRIAFRVSQSGMPVIILVTGHGSCEISLDGGQVLSYRPMGHVPVLFNSRESAQEEGCPIRGGISLCWPWFGEPPSPELPRHGFARLAQWNILSTEYDNKSSEVSLYLTDSDKTRDLWPHSFEIIQKITLSDSLTIAVTTMNKGSEPFELSQSIHPYFKVRDIEKVSISGVEKCEFTDFLTKERHIQGGPLSIEKETYDIYSDTKNACVIFDKGLGRNIAIKYSGMNKLIVWNPWIKKSIQLKDFGDTEYKNMLTVAPATLPAEKMILQPGKKVTVETSIQATLT